MEVKTNGGCKIMQTHLGALLQIHARQCKADNFVLCPTCLAIRERYRQLQMQQQAMDKENLSPETARADD